MLRRFIQIYLRNFNENSYCQIIFKGLYFNFFFIFSILIGLSVDSTGINFFETLIFIFNSHSTNSISELIFWEIRLPRVIISGLVGATLSLGGLVFQVLLRNPLAEPYILGISGGSAIGAIVGILTGLTYFPGITIAAFSTSMFTISLLILLTLNRSFLNKDSLLLTGVMVNSFCSAIIMLLIATSHDFRLHGIMFWLMGDFSMVNFSFIKGIIGILFFCFIVLFSYSNWMNLLLLGDEVAHSMGVHVKLVRMILFITSSFMISVVVSCCGLIGFVGLVVPHILRLTISTDCRVLVPSCIICGSSYLIICDVLSRIIFNSIEIPTGVITALIGAPIFIYLILMR